MAKRTRKCQVCGIDDTLMEEMECEIVGVKTKIPKYYHKKCYGKHLKEKKFKEEEQVKMDALNETLKEIYGVSQIPSQAWTLLQNMRNGEPVFGKRQRLSHRYKQGYDYLLIRDTFDYVSDTIEYHNRTKNFDGFMKAFKYGLAIVIDKIYFVELRNEKREQQKKMIEKHFETVSAEDMEFKSSYKRKEKSNTDITEFLDD